MTKQKIALIIVSDEDKIREHLSHFILDSKSIEEIIDNSDFIPDHEAIDMIRRIKRYILIQGIE